MIDVERLKERMEARNLSQAELARRVGIAQTSIFKLLSGQSYGSRHLHKIARELGTTPAYLTRETDDPESDQVDEVLSYEDRQDIALLQQLSNQDRGAIRQLMLSLTDKATPAPKPATLHSPQRKYAAGT